MTEDKKQVVFPVKYRLLKTLKVSWPYLYKSFFSVLVFIFICISQNFSPAITARINNYPNIDNVFVTFGSVLSAITALTISLAIIPIQRAIEIFSPSIRRIYINDFVVNTILTCLGISIFISFSLPFLGFSNNWKLYLQIEIIAISLDLVRWHFRRISFLLEPYNAIKSLSKKVCLLISKTQKTIAVSSFNELKKRPKSDWSQEVLGQIESFYYGFFEDTYFRSINLHIDELEDITLMAITRRERSTIRHGINAIVEIVCTFLDSRSANFRLYPVGLFSFGSDLDRIINPVYEKLCDICRLSIHNLDEQSAILTVNAISSIAIKTMELKGFHKHTAPLTGLPIGYLGMCSKLSHKSGLGEISWNVVNKLSDISEKAPDNLIADDVHMPVLRGLSSISQQEFIVNNDNTGKRAVSNICRVAHHLIEHNYYDFRTFLSLLIEELGKIVPLMLLKAKPLDNDAFPPYSMTNEYSLGRIVSIAASYVKADEDKDWINPYSKFMELNKEIYMHFRNLAENNLYDIQKSFLSWHITESIKHIAKVYLEIIELKITDNSEYNKQLISQVRWYQSFFGFMFDNKKEIYPQTIENFSDAMAINGLMFLNAEHDEVANNSISNIHHICKCYIEKTDVPDNYIIANVLIHIWHLRFLAENKDRTELIQKADKKIKETVDLASAKNIDIQEAFELRKHQLNNHLESYEHFPIAIHSQDYLKRYISI
ncbi:MAG: hypothetical protein ACUZ8I_05325 [Candidatus Scalindua sp.]